MSVQILIGGQWQTVADVLPPGAVVEISNALYIYTGSAWLPCNGAAVSRTTYAILFSAIGTTFGAGDGVTTFNVPNICQLELRPVVNLSAGQTFGAFVGDTDIFINNSSSASIDISAGATQAGIRISITEQNIQGVTIYTDAAHTQSGVLSKGMILLEWDGVQWCLIGENTKIVMSYTSNTNFKTPFAALYTFEGIGGGGGGAGDAQGVNATGGGASGVVGTYTKYEPSGVVITITIGAGGAGGPQTGGNGGAGGNTVISDTVFTLTCPGGSGGGQCSDDRSWWSQFIAWIVSSGCSF